MGILTNRNKTNLLHCLLVAYLALWCAGEAVAKSWWNGDWTVRRKIEIDTTSTGTVINDPIGTATVLIRLYDGNFQFALAKEDASDLRFVAADDKTVLTHHVEKFDSLLNEAFVWVKIPDLKPGAKTAIWLYYGNAGSTATNTSDAKATYDSDSVLVYHFAERGGAPMDSTASANNGQNGALAVEGSQIGSGVRFDGKTTVTIPPNPTLVWSAGAPLTWSAWIKPAVLEPNAILFSRRENTSGFVLGLDNGIPFVEVTDANGSAQRSTPGAALAVNAWRHLAVTAETGKISVYLDGELYAALTASVPALNSPATLGGVAADAPDAANVAAFSGEMDELEISRTARPTGFIKLAAIGQGGADKAGKLLVFGEDEQPSNWLSWMHGGYFGVILGSLTADGWAVICILFVMAVISWFVMVTKVRYLNGISKGNALFMKEWRHVAADLTILDDPDAEKTKSLGGRIDKAGQKAMREASVYRIYHIGVEEIRHRLNGAEKKEGRKGLPGRSIQAIRASLDGGLVRETQRINKLIVLLTICISGGPFLGLLGTVIGVMITFAAVAAAGDVNVNAIAPGIAAALLATVAGLAVAIPSLFGYNYILSRAKDATADMHVFIDEFVTRMAEFYKEHND